MKYQSIKRNLILGLLTLFLSALFPGTSRADDVILAGFDLFSTQPGTQVNLGPAGIQPLVGVPLGSFNFGMGPVATFNTDTIIQRLGNATVASPTVPIQMVALQLMSVNQFDLGAGVGFHFVTLQSVRGGPASIGTITFTGLGTEPAPGQPHGTFTSTIDVFFDIRLGSLNGPIVFSGSDTICSLLRGSSCPDGFPWDHFPGFSVLEIPGINTFLNGVDRGNDFFPRTGGPNDPCIVVLEEAGTTVIHDVCPATVPEPTTILLLGTGLAGVAIKTRRRLKGRKNG